MDQISCLILDDEPLARELLVNYCNYIPQLRIEAVCGHARDAKMILQTKPVDLIFLDIHLPVLDGIGFLQTLKIKPQVIMTTAYKQYAVNAFNLAVCDYLVKPFSLERFIVAVDKVIEKVCLSRVVPSRELADQEAVFIKTEGKIYRIPYQNLIFAEANGNHTKIVTIDKTIVQTTPFSALEKQLPTNRFIKVHRSFIVNQSKIDRIEGNRIFTNDYEIPIGKNYRNDLFNKLKL